MNPNEAPKGYIAKRADKSWTCKGCAFDETSCKGRYCLPSQRKDKTSVIFVKLPAQKKQSCEICGREYFSTGKNNEMITPVPGDSRFCETCAIIACEMLLSNKEAIKITEAL